MFVDLLLVTSGALQRLLLHATVSAREGTVCVGGQGTFELKQRPVAQTTVVAFLSSTRVRKPRPLPLRSTRSHRKFAYA